MENGGPFSPSEGAQSVQGKIPILGKFFHASGDYLPVGTILMPRPDYSQRWGHTDFYPVLERYRPAHCLSHAHAVFMCDSGEVLDAAGAATEWVFEVKPLGPVSRHDMNFSAAVSCALSEGQSEAVVADLARQYWMGVAGGDPLWEYLTSSARILKVERF